MSALRRGREQPGFAANGKGPDRILCQGIADVQSAILAITHQAVPLVQGVLHGFVRQSTLEHPGDILLEPGFQVIEYGDSDFLPGPSFLIGFLIRDL